MTQLKVEWIICSTGRFVIVKAVQFAAKKMQEAEQAPTSVGGGGE